MPEPTGDRVVALSLFGVKSQGTALTAPEGTGGSELLLVDERRDYSVSSRKWRPADRVGGRGVTTGPLRSVGSRSCDTGADVAWSTCVGVVKDGAGPVAPVGVFESGARASGNTFFARGSSFLLALLDERDEVARLVGSSLLRKMIERPLLSRGDA